MVARTNGRRLERVVERIGITSEAYSYGWTWGGTGLPKILDMESLSSEVAKLADIFSKRETWRTCLTACVIC